MKNYVKLCEDILNNGDLKGSRQGGKTYSLFGKHLEFDVSEKYPLMAIKKVKFDNIYHELIWFLRGDTNIKYLVDNGCNIWNGDAYRNFKEKFSTALVLDQKLAKKTKTEKDYIDNIKNNPSFAKKYGNLPKVYGHQWTNYNGWINQIELVLNTIKNSPDSRRHYVNAWNPQDMSEIALPPCHVSFQLYVSADRKKLSLQMYQRSADVFLGLPYNIASYGLLLNMFAHILGMKPYKLAITIGDAHIYEEHVDAVEELISRDKKTPELPTIDIKHEKDDKLSLYDNLCNIKLEDIIINDYNPLPYIKAPLIV